jgi:tripartite-type tricarboxylate transporter receptor subunit TctC
LLRDFAPVAAVSSTDAVMVVHPKVPANNLKEFIALAKAKPARSPTRPPVRARTSISAANCSS